MAALVKLLRLPTTTTPAKERSWKCTMRDKDSESLLGQHDHVVNRQDNPALYIFLCSIFETFSRICGKTIDLLLCLPKSLYYLSGRTLPLTYGQWVRGVMCYFQLEKLDIQLKCTPENSMPLNNHLYHIYIYNI